jgi:hypothetical protein
MSCEDKLVCPKCGKIYLTIAELTALKRLGGHLTGKHGLKGDDYFHALGQALERAHKEKQKHA